MRDKDNIMPENIPFHFFSSQILHLKVDEKEEGRLWLALPCTIQPYVIDNVKRYQISIISFFPALLPRCHLDTNHKGISARVHFCCIYKFLISIELHVQFVHGHTFVSRTMLLWHSEPVPGPSPIHNYVY